MDNVQKNFVLIFNCRIIFCTFKFRTLLGVRKYANTENFPNYGNAKYHIVAKVCKLAL